MLGRLNGNECFIDLAKACLNMHESFRIIAGSFQLPQSLLQAFKIGMQRCVKSSLHVRVLGSARISHRHIGDAPRM